MVNKLQGSRLMEMYLYFYLWLVCYKLGNKGIGNTILSQRVAGGKNAKIR